MQVHIRWMIRYDMEEVLSIEKESYINGWEEEDFLHYLRSRNTIAMVAEYKDKILGYMVYELHKNHLELHNLAVHTGFRHQDIGSQMVKKLIDKLSSNHRIRICVNIRETNLAAQLFFKSQGFVAVQVKRNFFVDSGEDSFVMEYSIAPDEDFQPENRLARYEEV